MRIDSIAAVKASSRSSAEVALPMHDMVSTISVAYTADVLGAVVGFKVDDLLGDVLGSNVVGVFDGDALGSFDGGLLGFELGEALGSFEGDRLGVSLGDFDGEVLGIFDGGAVVAPPTHSPSALTT